MNHAQTTFETSDHAKLLAKLDKKDGRRIEYWSKRNEK